MRCTEKKVIYNKGESIPLYLLGDTHFGHVGCDKDLIAEHVQRIKEEGALWAHLGDIADAITSSDRRYNVKNMDRSLLTLKEQYEYAAELLKPIGDTCVGILSGNHDEKVSMSENKGYDHVMDLAKEIGAPYLGYIGFVTLHFENQNKDRWGHKVFLWHGSGGGRKYGGKINRMTDLAADFIADTYAVGHYHQLGVQVKSVLEHVTNGRHNHIAKRLRVFAMCGGYLEGYVPNNTTYVEKTAYPPGILGCVKLEFFPDKRRVEARAVGEI